jgi:hypothetical protein
VQFVEHGIKVEPTGVLQIAGSEANPVQLTSYDQNPEPGAWSGIRMRESTASSYIRHAHIKYATTALELRDIEGATEGSPEVAHLDIRDVGSRGVMVVDSRVQLHRLTIRDFGEEAIRATGSETDVNITSADVQQERSSRIYVGDGLHVREGAIVELSGSTIRLAENGVVAYRSSSTPSVALENNIIKENRRGVFVDPRDSGRAYPEITANDNDIYDNVDWNVRLSAGSNPSTTALDFTDNWWGSTDGVEIASTIYDASNSSSRAFVDYLPFLNDSFENDGVSTSENYLSNLITEPTTWSAEGGPYVVTGRVIVRGDDAVLKIEAGTEVQFVEHGIKVEPTGVLQIAGSEADPVQLTSYDLDPEPGAWAGIVMKESTASSYLRHADIKYAATALELRDIEGATEGSPEVANLDIRDVGSRGVMVVDSKVELDGLTIRDFGDEGIRATGSDANVTITAADIQQEKSSRVHSGTGVHVRSGAIALISNYKSIKANKGLLLYTPLRGTSPRVNLNNSLLIENRVGVSLEAGRACYIGCSYGSSPEIVSNGNKIFDNIDWNVRMDQVSDDDKELDFKTNWWGVADSTAIADQIYDNSNNSNRATVLFEPFSLTEEGLLSPDINADGMVDGDDLVILGAAFGSDPSKDHWNPLADLTIQGRVNGFDLSVLATQFGEDVSPEAFVAQAADAEPLTAFSSVGANITTALVSEREEIAVDDTFRVSLRAADVPDLFGVTANLQVDTSFVEVVGFEEGPVLSNAGEQNTTFLHRAHADGRFMTGLTRMQATSAGATVDEAAKIWTVTLRARAAGETAIAVDRSRFIASDIQTTYPHELQSLPFTIADRNVLGEEDEGPQAFLLENNYPNPFQERTTIVFELPEREHVRIAVYDLLGREVAVLADEVFPAGRHETVWDAGTEASDLASGVYMYRLQAGEHVESKRMVLIR